MSVFKEFLQYVGEESKAFGKDFAINLAFGLFVALMVGLVLYVASCFIAWCFLTVGWIVVRAVLLAVIFVVFLVTAAGEGYNSRWSKL